MKKLIGTSPTQEGIISLINKFYYTTTISIDFNTGSVSNSKGLIDGVIVKVKKSRFRFEMI